MSITRTSTVFCDLPRDDHDKDHHGVTLCSGWAEETTAGPVEARRLARALGWHRINGKDYCPYAVKVVTK